MLKEKKYSPEPQLFTNELQEKISQIWELLIKDFPGMQELVIEKLIPQPNDFSQFTAGQFSLSKENKKATLQVVIGDQAHFEYLLGERQISNNLLFEKIGVPPEKRGAMLLSLIIFLHEAGHGYDFINNYKNNPDYETLAEATQAWNEHYEFQLSMLPVPGLDPSDLRLELQNARSFTVFVEKFGLSDTVKKHNISTASELLRLQEIAYRSLPEESYADQFAVDFIKRHHQEFGL